MAFRAEIAVSGLFIATIQGGEGERPESPTTVDVFSLKDRSRHGHRVYLNFLPDDVADAKDYSFNLGTDANGWHTITKGVAGTVIEIEAKVAGQVLKPDDLNPFEAKWSQDLSIPEEGALDWLPNLKDDFAIAEIAQIRKIGPDFNFWDRESNFMGMLRLPAGKLRSRAIIAHPAPFEGPAANFRHISQWVITRRFGNTGIAPHSNTKFLAEQLVWSLDGVDELTLRFGKDREITFDDAIRVLRGEEQVVRLSYTNLPTIGSVGRFGAPGHLSHFLDVEDSPASRDSSAGGCCCAPVDMVGLERNPDIPGGITNPSGSCPPAIIRIGGTT